MTQAFTDQILNITFCYFKVKTYYTNIRNLTEPVGLSGDPMRGPDPKVEKLQIVAPQSRKKNPLESGNIIYFYHQKKVQQVLLQNFIHLV